MSDQLKVDDYRNGLSGVGPQAIEWVDKPHRLVYDLCNAVEARDAQISALTAQLTELKAEHQGCLDGDTAWAEKWKARAEKAEAQLAQAEQERDQMSKDYGVLLTQAEQFEMQVGMLKVLLSEARAALASMGMRFGADSKYR